MRLQSSTLGKDIAVQLGILRKGAWLLLLLLGKSRERQRRKEIILHHGSRWLLLLLLLRRHGMMIHAALLFIAQNFQLLAVQMRQAFFFNGSSVEIRSSAVHVVRKLGTFHP